MMLVLDSSVGFQWQIQEEGSDKALRVRIDKQAAYQQPDRPDTMPSED